MNYKLEPLPLFEKQFRRLAKKYPSLISEMAKLGYELSSNPNIGIPIGNNCFKIRLSIKSKGRGKSGGAKLITNLFFEKEIIFLISIYDKSERDSLSDSETLEILKTIIK